MLDIKTYQQALEICNQHDLTKNQSNGRFVLLSSGTLNVVTQYTSDNSNEENQKNNCQILKLFRHFSYPIPPHISPPYLKTHGLLPFMRRNRVLFLRGS